MLYIAKSKFGRGVFTSQPIKKGQTVHVAQALLVPMEQVDALNKTRLYFYYYEWTKKHVALILGHGSMFNHSYTANVEYSPNYKQSVMTYTAVKNIPAGSELFINYNGDATSKKKVIFE